MSVELLLLATTLAAVALIERRATALALAGLAALVAFKLGFAGFEEGAGGAGLARHLQAHARQLANLAGLLPAFAIVADRFSQGGTPAALQRFLPAGAPGAFALLAAVFVLSGVLDNIAAALIGGAMARVVFCGRVHPGYIVGLAAAANAGGAGSVLGDTTTSMLWIGGVRASEVAPAYFGAAAAMLVCGSVASIRQARLQPPGAPLAAAAPVDVPGLLVVVAVVVAPVAANLIAVASGPGASNALPWIGMAPWLALLLAAPLRPVEWRVARDALGGTGLVLTLVLMASMVPVDRLPPPTHASLLGLGFVSAVFDNIPLTALALRQGGYEWSLLAYAVGFGGSMLWFGSSAGVALATMFPEVKSLRAWMQGAWHLPLAYIAGFLAQLALLRLVR